MRFLSNKAALISSIILSIIILMSIFAPLITPTGYEEQKFLINNLAFPSFDHWFGIDDLGRDFYTRIIYGARVSLSIGFVAAAFSVFIGFLRINVCFIFILICFLRKYKHSREQK